MNKITGLFFLLVVFFLSGCATVIGSLNPRLLADSMAKNSGFSKQFVDTSYFKLTAYSRLTAPGGPLVVYIEGDGRAWLSKNRLSEDPTPHHPLVLTLASEDDSDNVVYLARPCQYETLETDPHCGPAYWSDKRFSEEVVASMNEAVDQLKRQADATAIHLIGYSGGGAVAVLVAARRNDVASLRTIAGNLDHEAVNRANGVSLLRGSLNALDYAQKVASIPQEHLVGGKDKIVPPLIAKKFAKKANNPACIKITEVPNATHESGWIEVWPQYLHRTPACEDNT